MPPPVRVKTREFGSDGPPYLLQEEQRLNQSIGSMERSLNDIEDSLKDRFRQLVISQLSLLRYCDPSEETQQVSLETDNSIEHKHIMHAKDQYSSPNIEAGLGKRIHDIHKRHVQSPNHSITFHNENMDGEFSYNEMDATNSKLSPRRSVTYRSEVIDRRPNVHFTPSPKYTDEQINHTKCSSKVIQAATSDYQSIHELSTQTNVPTVDISIERNVDVNVSPKHDIINTREKIASPQSKPTPFKRSISPQLISGQLKENHLIRRAIELGDKKPDRQGVAVSETIKSQRINSLQQNKDTVNLKRLQSDTVSRVSGKTENEMLALDTLEFHRGLRSPARTVNVEANKRRCTPNKESKDLKHVSTRKTEYYHQTRSPMRAVKTENMSSGKYQRNVIKHVSFGNQELHRHMTPPTRSVKIEQNEMHPLSMYQSQVLKQMNAPINTNKITETGRIQMEPTSLKHLTMRKLDKITKQTHDLADNMLRTIKRQHDNQDLANKREIEQNYAAPGRNNTTSKPECNASHRHISQEEGIREMRQFSPNIFAPNTRSKSPTILNRSPVVNISVNDELKTTSESVDVHEIQRATDSDHLASANGTSGTYRDCQSQKGQLVGGVATILSSVNDAVKDSAANGIDPDVWKGVQRSAAELEGRISSVCAQLVSTSRLLPETCLRNAETRIQLRMDKLFAAAQNPRATRIPTTFKENLQHDLHVLQCSAGDTGEVAQSRRLLAEMRHVLAVVHTMAEGLRKCGKRLVDEDAAISARRIPAVPGQRAPNEMIGPGGQSAVNILQKAAQALVPLLQPSPAADADDDEEYFLATSYQLTDNRHLQRHFITQVRQLPTPGSDSSRMSSGLRTPYIHVGSICKTLIVVVLGIAVGLCISAFGQYVTEFSAEVLRKVKIFWCCLFICYKNAPIV